MTLVTICGVPGAPGDEVAATLAAHLGYRLVNGQELVHLARSGGYAKGFIQAWPRWLAGTGHWPGLRERIRVDRSRYVRALRHLMLDLTIEDDVVVVGPGAGQVAPELRQVVRVLLVASGEVRLGLASGSGAMQSGGPIRERGCKRLAEHDLNAARYMRFVFELEDWADPRHWDLVIDTDRLGVAMAAALVSVAVDRRRAPDPEDGRRLADLLLARRVERAVLDRTDVNVCGLRVRVDAANVEIRGTVQTEIERQTVSAIVQTIRGVRRLDNQVRMHMPFLTI